MRLDVDDPRECGQKQEADSAAKERPRRCPDAFHNRANPGEMQDEARKGEKRSGDQEAPDGNSGRDGAKPFTCAQTEQHGAQSRDKTEREIAAFVVRKARRTRK